MAAAAATPTLTPTAAFASLFGPQPIAGSERAAAAADDDEEPLPEADLAPAPAPKRVAIVTARDQATKIRLEGIWSILYHELAPTAEGLIATAKTVPPPLAKTYEDARRARGNDIPDLDTLLSSHDQMLAISTVAHVLVAAGKQPDEISQWFAQGTRSSRVWLDVIAQRAKGVGATPLWSFLVMVAGHRSPRGTASSLLNDEIAQQLRAAQAQVAARLRQDMDNVTQQIKQLNVALSVEDANIDAAQLASQVLSDFYLPVLGQTKADAIIALFEAVLRCKEQRAINSLDTEAGRGFMRIATEANAARRDNLGDALQRAPLWYLYTLGSARAAAIAFTDVVDVEATGTSVSVSARTAAKKQMAEEPAIGDAIARIVNSQLNQGAARDDDAGGIAFRRLAGETLATLRNYGLDAASDSARIRAIRSELASTIATVAGAFLVDPEYEDANLFKLLNVDLFYQPERIDYFAAWTLTRYRDPVLNDHTQLTVDPALRTLTIAGELSHVSPAPFNVRNPNAERVDVDRLGIAPSMPLLLPKVDRVNASRVTGPALFDPPTLWIADPEWAKAYNADAANSGTAESRGHYYLDNPSTAAKGLTAFIARVRTAVTARDRALAQPVVAAAAAVPVAPAAAPPPARPVRGRTGFDVLYDVGSAARYGATAVVNFLSQLRRTTPATVVAGEPRGDLLGYEWIVKDPSSVRDRRIAFANQAGYLQFFVQKLLADPYPVLDVASAGDLSTATNLSFPIRPPASSDDQALSVRPATAATTTTTTTTRATSTRSPFDAGVQGAVAPAPLDWMNAQISAFRDALGIGGKAGAGSVGLIYDALPDGALLRPAPSSDATEEQLALARERVEGLAQLVAYWSSRSSDLSRAEAAQRVLAGITPQNLGELNSDGSWPWDPKDTLLEMAANESSSFDVIRAATEDFCMNTYCDAGLALEKVIIAKRLVMRTLKLFVETARGVHETRRRRVQGLVSATALSAASLRGIGAYAEAANRGSAGSPEFEMLPYISGRFWLGPSVLAAMQDAEQDIKQCCANRTTYGGWKENGLDNISIEDIANDGRPEAQEIRARMAKLVALFMQGVTGLAGWIQTKVGVSDLVEQQKRIYVDLFNFRWDPQLRTLVRRKLR